MKCPKCRSDNAETSRFCSNCATALSQAGQPPAAAVKTLESPGYALIKGSLVAGKYRILEEIGRGGMGVVHLAEDTKLGRKVAIKILPETFTADPERLARFEREARVLASLNHPNIAAIYGVEEADSRRFLVLELVEGETLAERLTKGPLPLEETLGLFLQIAAGLEDAHEKGIIHRDLKPANVKITPEGKAKILDFGLAKSLVAELTSIDMANSPTITANMTQPGVIIGTAAYMSPEQATGRPVDKRADIWAFGCLLYECLTGKRAFPGDTVTESMAAVLKGEPDWNALPAGTPQNVRAVLRRCFQKTPHLRLRDIGDARLELEAPPAYPPEGATARSRPSLVVLASGMACALLAGIFIGPPLMRKIRPVPVPTVITSTIKLEPGHRLAGMGDFGRPSRKAMVISSDGRFVVYSAVEDGPGLQSNPRLFLRSLDQPEAKPIAGTEGGIHPFLSPDNNWVGFLADDKLKKIQVAGGVATVLCNAVSIFGADWGGDDRIVFTDGSDNGLSIVPAAGGKPESLTKVDPEREESSHRLPRWLPDGQAVLFTVMRHDWDAQPRLAIYRLETHDWRVLLEDAADASYVPTGHLVFMRQGTLMAVRFDPARLEVVGQPVALTNNVMQSFTNNSQTNTGAGQFGISDTGMLLYAPGGIAPDPRNSLVWVDQKGTEQPIAPLESPFLAPRLSPDGQRIAYVNVGREWRVWVYDLTRGTNTPLTVEGWATFPTWTPDGRRLLFAWMKSGPPNLFWQPYDGSSPMERLTTTGDYVQMSGAWSPDGGTVAFTQDAGKDNDILVLDVRSRQVKPLLNSPANEQWPDISPDGRWIAYSSDESKRFEVYVRPFPGLGQKYQVSSEGGSEPLWARDGKKIFYRWGDKVWAVEVGTGGGFSAGKPRLLFEKPGFGGGAPIRTYDLSLDSQRFLMVKLEQRQPAPVAEMVLVQNWFADLKRLVPAEKK